MRLTKKRIGLLLSDDFLENVKTAKYFGGFII